MEGDFRRNVGMHQVSLCLVCSIFMIASVGIGSWRLDLRTQISSLLLWHYALVHGGPRLIIGEGMASLPITPAQSILAGCPVSIAFAQLYLWQSLQYVHSNFRPVQVCSWVDDISFDLVGKDCKSLSKYMTKIFRALQTNLRLNNFTINKDKSGFLCNTLALTKAMKKEVQQDPDMPHVKDAVRDLGFGAAAGRLRRIPAQKSRQQKGKRASADCAPHQRSQVHHH